MKRKVYLLVVVLGIIGLMASCRGFKSAPPCPAYSSVEMPVNQSR
jgi:hypothetical protein